MSGPNKNSPCKYCADRVLGCHGVCKDYIEWKREHEAEAEWNRKNPPVRVSRTSFTGTSPKPGKHVRTRHKRGTVII